ncbi:hypothetical protein WJX73_008745 [Symbiochloris irregularis]|uniref:Ankyrin repeat domain-containing protein 39 n=1 Tax=Symbiochloris irregularis TaxID=706552 RepID=A0AAW1PS10_9CHLO
MESGGTACHAHQPGTCNCSLTARPGTQTLDELEFDRGVCGAAQRGNVQKLRQLLSRHSDVLQSTASPGSDGYSPLHYASRAGHLQAVELLLSSGAAVNQMTTAGRATSLHRAAHMGHCSVLQCLLKHGAAAALQDADGETALHKAAAQKGQKAQLHNGPLPKVDSEHQVLSLLAILAGAEGGAQECNLEFILV